MNRARAAAASYVEEGVASDEQGPHPSRFERCSLWRQSIVNLLFLFSVDGDLGASEMRQNTHTWHCMQQFCPPCWGEGVGSTCVGGGSAKRETSTMQVARTLEWWCPQRHRQSALCRRQAEAPNAPAGNRQISSLDWSLPAASYPDTIMAPSLIKWADHAGLNFDEMPC